jgi:tetratricopeptide (TPR) repeat protein
MSAPPAAPPSRLSRFLRRPELWVFLVALLARLVVLLSFSESPHFGVQGGDSKFYHDWALRILHGQWTDHHAFYGLPGYAYLLAALYALFGVEPFVPIALQAGLDAITAVLTFVFARRIADASPLAQRSPKAPALIGAGAALGWILFVPAQSFALVLMPTSWLVAAYWGGLWLILRLRKSSTVFGWAALGVGIGAVAMLVATILFLLPLALAANLWRRAVSWRVRIAAAVLTLGGVFLGCAPAWSHNAFVAHEPVLLSAHGGINFWIGNHPGADGYPKIPEGLRTGQQELLDDSITIAQRESGRPLTRPEVSHFWSEKAWRTIRENPARWARLLLLKLQAFWSRFEYDDLTIIALLKGEGVLWPGIRFGLVSAFGFLGLALVCRENAPGRWVGAAVLLHLLALMPVFITERYRLAAVPGLLALGAYAVARIADWWRAMQWRPLAVCAGVLALWAAAFARNDHGGRLTSMVPYNLAVSELDAAQRLREELAAAPGDARKQQARERMLMQAAEHLRDAEKFAPNSAILHLAYGRYWTEEGDRPKAKAAYARAHEAEPAFADAATNLAVMEIQDARWGEAAVLLEEVTAHAPNEPGGFYLLALAREGLKQREAALQAVQRALQLEPQNPAFTALEGVLRER